MFAFQVRDVTTVRCTGAATQALKPVDHRVLAWVEQDELTTFTVEVEPSSASARQLSDATKRAGRSPLAACRYARCPRPPLELAAAAGH